MLFGEYNSGVVQGEQEVLMINIGWGLGMGIICKGQLYYGKSGYSGEFGHSPVFDNNIICQCGKKGCLETEVSGQALERKVSRARVGPQKDEVGELLNQIYVSYDEVIYTSVNVTVCFPKPSFYCRVALSKCETDINLCIGCQTSNH
jgi:predicted NBD/HSP70 family sugar kinase